MYPPEASLSYTLPVIAPQSAPPEPPAFEEGDTVIVGPEGVRFVARSASDDEGRPAGAVAHQNGRNGKPLELVCLFCGGPLRRGQAPVRVVREGYRLECSLPAWVCKRCDEPYFEPPEVARVREALRFVRRRARA
jgi:YgiT-type zinc finger domain-containing protein